MQDPEIFLATILARGHSDTMDVRLGGASTSPRRARGAQNAIRRLIYIVSLTIFECRSSEQLQLKRGWSGGAGRLWLSRRRSMMLFPNGVTNQAADRLSRVLLLQIAELLTMLT